MAKLAERMDSRRVRPALIQNGSDPGGDSEGFTTHGAKLAERASTVSVPPALIQNGNDPGEFTEDGS